MANKIITAFLLIACTISCEGKLTITGEAQCHGDSKINGKSCHDLCKCGSCKSTDNMKTWTCNARENEARKLDILDGPSTRFLQIPTLLRELRKSDETGPRTLMSPMLPIKRNFRSDEGRQLLTTPMSPNKRNFRSDEGRQLLTTPMSPNKRNLRVCVGLLGGCRKLRVCVGLLGGCR